MNATRIDYLKRMRQLKEQELAYKTNFHRIIANQQKQQQQRVISASASASSAGLLNLGNTCYMNSVLQCICRSLPFCQYLLGENFIKDKICFVNQKPLYMAFVAEIQSLIQKINKIQSGQPTIPKEILKLLVIFNNTFQGNVQSDAQECLTTILQVLHSALTLNVKITISDGAGISQAYEHMRKGYQQYQSHLKHNGYSMIDDIFGSQFESLLICNRCGKKSSSFDPYSLVPVELSTKVLTLYNCLDLFMAAETINDVDCEQCSKTHGKTQCTKQFRLWTLPKVLIIQLKRFDMAMRKIDRSVQAPKILNLTQYVSHPKVTSQIQHNPAALQLYELKSIICHSGQMNGGHYTAKCLCSDDKWYDFNDVRVTPISDSDFEQSLHSPLNYILFYEMSEKTKKFWNK